MLTHGTRSHVSLFPNTPDPDLMAEYLISTGSLSLVRTILKYQNVTPDPTRKPALPAPPQKPHSATNIHSSGLSVPNWYWRTWEVLFGVVAACIPTLQPLYKYLLQKVQTRSNYRWILQYYSRKSSSNNKTTITEQRSEQKPAVPSKTDSGGLEDSTLHQEDILPLHVKIDAPATGFLTSPPNYRVYKSRQCQH